MTSDNARHVPDVKFQRAGTGLPTSWECFCCRRRSYDMTGRRKWRLHGLWVCAQCQGARKG